MDGLGWEDGAHNQRTPCFTLTHPHPSWFFLACRCDLLLFFLNPIEIKL